MIPPKRILARGAALAGLIAGTVLLAVPHPARAAVVVSTQITLGDINGISAAAIDTTSAYGYFATTDSLIFRVGLSSPFTTTPFFSDVSRPSALLIDVSSGMIYSVIGSTPLGGTAAIAKQRLSDLSLVDTMTITGLSGPVGAAAITSTGTYAILGSSTSPATIYKVRLADLVVVTSTTLNTGNYVFSAAIDDAGGFVYIGSSGAAAGVISKLNLSDLSPVSSLTLNAGEGPVQTIILDVPNHNGFFGTGSSPARIIKVNLSNMQRIATTSLATGDNSAYSSVSDGNGHAYFGLDTSPGVISGINLATNAKLPDTTVPTGLNQLRSAIIDTVNSYAYYGTYGSSATVVQVDLIGGAPQIDVSPKSQTVKVGGTASFFVTATGRSLTYQWLRNGALIPGASGSSYVLNNVQITDSGSLFSCAVSNSSGTTVSQAAMLTVSPVVRVYPNPWRIDRHAGHPITFDQLAPNSTIKLFTLSMHWIKTLQPVGTMALWDLTNDAGQRVASGYYFYLITTGNSDQQTDGKIGILK